MSSVAKLPKIGGTVYVIEINYDTLESKVCHCTLKEIRGRGTTAVVQIGREPAMQTAVDTHNVFTTSLAAYKELSFKLRMKAADIALVAGETLGKLGKEIARVDMRVKREAGKKGKK